MKSEGMMGEDLVAFVGGKRGAWGVSSVGVPVTETNRPLRWGWWGSSWWCCFGGHEFCDEELDHCLCLV